MSWESIGKATLVMGGLVASAVVLGKFAPTILKGALALGALGLAILPLGYGLSLLQGVTWESLGIAATALTGLALAAAALSPILPFIAAGALAIGLLGAALIPLAFGLQMLGGIQWKSFDGMLGVLTSLTIGAAGLLLAAPGLILSGLALIPFATGMKMLSGIDFKSFKGIGDAIAEICSHPIATLAAAPGLAAMGLALIPVATAFNLMSGINFKSGFAGIGNVIYNICNYPLKTLAAAPGLAAMGLALIPFSLGIKALSAVDFKAVAGIGEVITEITAAAVGLLLAAPALISSGVAMIPFAAGISILKAAIGEDGGVGLTSFLRDFVELTERLKPDQLFQAAVAITALGASIAAFGATQVVAGLGNFVGKLLNFGGNSPIEQLVKLSAEAGNLGVIGKGVEQIANGLVVLAGLGKSIDELNNIPWERIGKLAGIADKSSPIQIYTGVASATSTEATTQGNIQPASITQSPNTTGAELLDSTTNIMSSPVVVNNYGGNISNNSTSAVSNNSSSYDPIIAGSAMGFANI